MSTVFDACSEIPCQAFSVRKTPVFRTPGGREKSRLNSTLFVPGATGGGVIIEAVTGTARGLCRIGPFLEGRQNQCAALVVHSLPIDESCPSRKRRAPHRGLLRGLFRGRRSESGTIARGEQQLRRDPADQQDRWDQPPFSGHVD